MRAGQLLSGGSSRLGALLDDPGVRPAQRLLVTRTSRWSRKKQFTETQIVKVLKEAAAGAKEAAVCRRNGGFRCHPSRVAEEVQESGVSEATRQRKPAEGNRRPSLGLTAPRLRR
jgi:hypothetical protein